MRGLEMAPGRGVMHTEFQESLFPEAEPGAAPRACWLSAEARLRKSRQRMENEAGKEAVNSRELMFAVRFNS